MTTLMRRQHGPLDLADWMNRFFDDRLLPERFGLLDKDLLRVEELTEGDTLVIRAELPGIDPDKDVEISMHDGLLHIRAERKESTEHKDKAEYRSEFRYGMFERALPVPAGVTEKDVTATYKDGILEVRLPRTTTEAKGATVPVVRLP
jgi:HSP20 family protein